jgi:hypothetical protein
MHRLVGGIHRDVTSRTDDPSRFYLAIDRGLKSGNLDEVEVDEQAILKLLVTAAQALEMLRGERA